MSIPQVNKTITTTYFYKLEDLIKLIESWHPNAEINTVEQSGDYDNDFLGIKATETKTEVIDND